MTTTIITNVTLANPTTPYVRVCCALPKPLEWTAAFSPFTVKGPNNTEVDAQWERHVMDEDGHVVSAEFIWPHSGPGVYTIVQNRKSKHEQRCNPGRWASGFVDSLVSDLGLTPAPRYLKYGSYLATKGYHSDRYKAWLTVYEGLDIVDVTLVMHNCVPGSGDDFFDNLDIVESGGVLEAPWHEGGDAIEHTLFRAGGLVSSRPDDRSNVLPRKATRVFRFVVHDGSQVGLASQIATGAAWAAPDALWLRRGHQVQPCPLPDLRASAAPLRSLTTSRTHNLDTGLLNRTQCGLGTSNPPKPMGDVGFMPPWSVEYGGLTGGSADYGGRNAWIGYEFAGTSDAEFLRWLMTWQMMVLNRCPVTILEPDGRPVRLSDWINANGTTKGGWDVSASDLRFERNNNLPDAKDGAFGFAGAISPIDPVLLPSGTLAKLSSYSTNDPYMPIDFDHFDRAFSPSTALAGLCNDPASIWHLRAWAEQVTMSWYTSGFIGTVGTHEANPGHGTHWTRNPAHPVVLMANAYRYSGRQIRNDLRPWLQRFARGMVAAQMVNGLYSAWDTKTCDQPPFGDGTSGSGPWVVTKVTNECMLANALWAVIGSGALTEGQERDARESIVRWAIKGLWEYLWGSGSTGAAPSNFVNVRPRAFNTEPLLAPTIRVGNDIEEVGSALGAALWCALDPNPLFPMLYRYCGGATSLQGCLAWFNAKPLNQTRYDDSAPIRAWLEVHQ